MEEKNVIIICITAILCLLIISGTFIYLNLNNNGNSFININNEGNSQGNNIKSSDEITVNSVTFYSDGNPNTRETATVNVGKEHAGKTINVLTLYSRDNVQQSDMSVETPLTVDSDGNVVITDYTPMPKYPDYCYIQITYNGHIYQYECDIATHKGTQTAIPRKIS